MPVAPCRMAGVTLRMQVIYAANVPDSELAEGNAMTKLVCPLLLLLSLKLWPRGGGRLWPGGGGQMRGLMTQEDERVADPPGTRTRNTKTCFFFFITLVPRVE